MTEATACLLFTPLSVDRDGGRGASSQLPPSPDSGETTHAQSTKLTEHLCVRGNLPHFGGQRRTP